MASEWIPWWTHSVVKKRGKYNDTTADPLTLGDDCDSLQLTILQTYIYKYVSRYGRNHLNPFVSSLPRIKRVFVLSDKCQSWGLSILLVTSSLVSMHLMTHGVLLTRRVLSAWGAMKPITALLQKIWQMYWVNMWWVSLQAIQNITKPANDVFQLISKWHIVNDVFRLLMKSDEVFDVYEVNETGFLRCDIEHGGVPYNRSVTTAAVNVTSTTFVAVPRDRLRHPGSYYFVGEYNYTGKNQLEHS